MNALAKNTLILITAAIFLALWIGLIILSDTNNIYLPGSTNGYWIHFKVMIYGWIILVVADFIYTLVKILRSESSWLRKTFLVIASLVVDGLVGFFGFLVLAVFVVQGG